MTTHNKLRDGQSSGQLDRQLDTLTKGLKERLVLRIEFLSIARV